MINWLIIDLKIWILNSCLSTFYNSALVLSSLVALLFLTIITICNWIYWGTTDTDAILFIFYKNQCFCEGKIIFVFISVSFHELPVSLTVKTSTTWNVKYLIYYLSNKYVNVYYSGYNVRCLIILIIICYLNIFVLRK